MLAIGGLISRQISDARAYTPWLHRIPVLGWLWKSFDQGDEDLELVVVVSPTILREREPRMAMWSFPDELELLGAMGSPIPVPASTALVDEGAWSEEPAPAEPTSTPEPCEGAGCRS